MAVFLGKNLFWKTLLGSIGGGAGLFFFSRDSAASPSPEVDHFLGPSRLELRREFLRYASQRDTSDVCLNQQDFLKLYASPRVQPSLLKLLQGSMSMSNNSAPLINFSQYLNFCNNTFWQPDAAFLLAYHAHAHMEKTDELLDFDSFVSLVPGLKKDAKSLPPTLQTLLNQYFGADRKQGLSLDRYRHLIHDLQATVAQSEFEQLSAAHTKPLQLEQIAEVLARNPSVPKYFCDDLNRVAPSMTNINFNHHEYLAWKHLGFLADVVVQRLHEEYHASGKKVGTLSRQDFKRVVESTCNMEAPSEQWLQAAMHVFRAPQDPPHALADQTFNVLGQRLRHGLPPSPVVIPMPATIAMAATASAVAGTVIFPLDKVKTRLQSIKSGSSSMIGMFRHIVQTEGSLSLFRGLGPQLVGIMPEKALKLTLNKQLREMLMNPYMELTVPREVLAGALTGLVQVLITNPYEVVKIRLQMQTAGSQKGGLTVLRELGLRGLYQGVGATIARDVPFNMFYFSLYNVLKAWFAKPGEKLGTVPLLASGMMAATVAAAFTTPADVIKTRLQNGAAVYKSVPDCFRQTVANEGYKALFKGIGPRCMIISPLFGITFMIYEKLQQHFFPGYGQDQHIVDYYAKLRADHMERIQQDWSNWQQELTRWLASPPSK
eukprot:TRINITY_DN1573_c0_g1_i2.p1 TRINITY_DN1573_c0_g1~~TRINITY_DN1573_c0_g1_i2.p1  ORF type:complete len:659 (+),score=187.14 TRINITY_DN1573_c0_g1_i2:93-2069(+)